MQDIAAIESIIAEGALNGKTLRRTDEQPMRVSVIDWIMAITNKNQKQASQILLRILNHEPMLSIMVEWFQFPGQRQRFTPVTHARGLSSILSRMPCQHDNPEKAVADALAQKVSGRREVRVTSGSVDIVTSEYAIEVKYWTDWKQAIGQAFVYARDLKLKPKIHLFVPTSERASFMLKVAHIRESIEAASIELSWEIV